MKKYLPILQQLGGILILLGITTLFGQWQYARYVYCLGAVLFAIPQLLDTYKGENLVLKRLYRQLSFGAMFMLLSGVLMFTMHHNEYVLSLSIAAVIEVYAIFRISSIEKKTKN
jgi:hypothetical protein